MAMDPRYRAVVDRCESFLVTNPGNWPALDLSPLGIDIPISRRYAATSLASAGVVDGLHRLDALTFTDQGMVMPRWVLFDCGEFPGIVYGFGRRAADLPAGARRHYQVESPDRDDAFVPLSMWVAIRCAEDGAWFGHNLSSANLLLSDDAALPGLATVTKALGMRVTRADKQYGATQWDSESLGVHLRFGEMSLVSAYTPAHTHAETLTYRVDVGEARLRACLGADWRPPALAADREIEAGDADAMRALQADLERGERWQIVGCERAAAGRPQRARLRRIT
jgi:hypothetical protein